MDAYFPYCRLLIQYLACTVFGGKLFFNKLVWIWLSVISDFANSNTYKNGNGI